MAERPTGTVTFLFTDIEGSTRLWEDHPVEMEVALALHDQLVRSVLEEHGGYVFSTAGDAFVAAFAGAGRALDAAQAIQHVLSTAPWPANTPIRVRIGIHTGEAQERDGAYFGSVLNRTARIMSAGHGGQILISSSTAGLIEPDELIELGEHRLKDLSASQLLFQLGDGSFPALRSLEAVRHNLPVERTPLIGREDAIDQITELVAQHRLVTLLGIGGIGKTRLATAVAAENADRFSDGVWFVDLVAATGAEHVFEAIATSAGLSVLASDLVGALAALISSREMLIVLDNCEHITSDVADVVDALLEHTNSPRFIATSREPLQLLDERQLHVPPLAIGDDLASPAVALFSTTAERVDAKVDRDDVHVASWVCAQLDGIPLAIELAAAQLRQYSLVELAERLDRRFEILDRRSDRQGRQRSLQAVLEDTWAMLDNQEQELLLFLAAFPSSFAAEDVEAAQDGAGIGPVGRMLAGLVDHSLVARDAEGRHRLLETVKLFARDRWPQDTPDHYLERHTAWVLDHLSSYPPEEWYTSAVLATWANSHYEDHRLAEDRLAAAGRVAELAGLLGPLTGFTGWQPGLRAATAIDRIEGYLEQLQIDAHQEAVLNLHATEAALACGRMDWVGTGSDRATQLFRKAGRPEELAWALIARSWTGSFQDLEDVLRLLDEAEVLADDADAPAIADIALAQKANLLALGRQTDEALARLDDLRVRIEDRPFDRSWNEYWGLTSALLLVRDPEAARAAAVALHAEIERLYGGRALTCTWHVRLAQTAAACGDVEGTRQGLARAEDAAQDDESRDGLPDLLIPPAALAWSLGRDDLSRAWLTAVRHAPAPPYNFLLIISYRQLRDEVGLLDHNPLNDNTIDEIYQEATDWLASL